MHSITNLDVRRLHFLDNPFSRKLAAGEAAGSSWTDIPVQGNMEQSASLAWCKGTSDLLAAHACALQRNARGCWTGSCRWASQFHLSVTGVPWTRMDAALTIGRQEWCLGLHAAVQDRVANV